jgi:hypothetical protein
MMKSALALSVFLASASAFSPVQRSAFSTALFNGPEIGAGGMADTRNPNSLEHEDARKSISAAPSFEEYLKMRDSGGAAPAAPAVAAPPAAAVPAAPAAAAAPVPTAGAGGDVIGTLAGLQGPGQVWGADGIAVGKEESDLKGYDNFGLFVERLQSSGVASDLSGPGPFTIFAPVDSAIETYETNFGPFDAAICNLHIVNGNVPSSSVGSADLTSLTGEKLVYKRAFRKDFVNDVIIGEKTFGRFEDFPTDVSCSNGVIHSVGISLAS